MRVFWLFAFCLLLMSCGNPAKPIGMNNQRLIGELRKCGIDPADAVEVNEQVSGQTSNYLVFSPAAPYPEAKMHCLARTLVRADYGVRKSGEQFDSAYRPAWNAEFAAYMQERAVSWLREHRPGKRAPQFVEGKLSLQDFARELEEFCGAKLGTFSVNRQSLEVPGHETGSQSECLIEAALAANPTKHGFAVHIPGYY